MAGEFLMLAQDLNPQKHVVAGFFVSEKLDGMRAYWDGGISRGVPAAQVPWANTDKHDRFVNAVYSTGLWTRYGQPIQATKDFLDKLPTGMMLDGELWAGRGRFQDVVSCCKRLVPEPLMWKSIKYMVFDSPPFEKIFKSRTVDNLNMKKDLVGSQIMAFMRDQAMKLKWPESKWQSLMFKALDFRDVYSFFTKCQPPIENDVLKIHSQKKLSANIKMAQQELDAELQVVEALGGEGLMLRRPVSYWTPERSHNLLKVKSMRDMEVTVVGYKWGRETDKGSKLLGMMGAATCKMDDGKVFDLSGFTDEERIMMSREVPEGYSKEGDTPDQIARWFGKLHPGEVVPEAFFAKHFPRGTRITIRYRELTDAGIPKEARYWRKPIPIVSE